MTDPVTTLTITLLVALLIIDRLTRRCSPLRAGVDSEPARSTLTSEGPANRTLGDDRLRSPH